MPAEASGNAGPMLVNGFASGIFILLVVLNTLGSGFVGRAELVLVGFKLGVLGLLIAAGAYGMMMHPASKAAAPPVLSVVSGVGLTFLADAGFGIMTNAASRVPRPRTTMPHALHLALAIVPAVYVALAVVVVGSVPIHALAIDADTAVAVAARPVPGPAGQVIVSVAALVATASGINAWIFTALKLAPAMARAGQLPSMFAQPLRHEGMEWPAGRASRRTPPHWRPT